MLTGSVTDFELPSPLKCQGTSAIVAYISPFTRYICYLPASFWKSFKFTDSERNIFLFYSL